MRGAFRFRAFGAEYLALSWMESRAVVPVHATQHHEVGEQEAEWILGSLELRTDCLRHPGFHELWAEVTGTAPYGVAPSVHAMLDDLQAAARRGSLVLVRVDELRGSPLTAAVPSQPALTSPLADSSVDDSYTLEIERLYHDDRPVRRAPFEVVLADGTRITGALDTRGRATVANLKARPTAVSFQPDAREYAPAAGASNPAYRSSLSGAAIDELIRHARGSSL